MFQPQGLIILGADASVLGNLLAEEGLDFPNKKLEIVF